MTYNFGNYAQPYQQRGFKVLPVANEFEMNNITVDFNGTPTYFHNQNLNEIYVKQFDIKTGMTTTQKFIHSDNAEHDLSMVNSEKGNNIYEEKLNAINDRLDGLKEQIEKLNDRSLKK